MYIYYSAQTYLYHPNLSTSIYNHNLKLTISQKGIFNMGGFVSNFLRLPFIAFLFCHHINYMLIIG